MSNPLDSQKTKLLKTKTVDFSINIKQLSSNYFKKAKIMISFFIEKSKKQQFQLLVFSISTSPIQRIGQK